MPQSFIRERSVRGKPNLIISNKSDYARRSWTGVYDNALVCAICEAGFSEYDRYGHRFFHAERLVPRYSEGELLVWQHPDADAVKLKLFVLSILWRASVSRRPEFRAVDLDRCEPEIRRMIATDDPGAPDRFPVMLERFDAPPSLMPLVYPYRTVIGDTMCYKIELAGCTAITAIQGRELPSVLIDIALAPGRPVYLIPKSYETSQERSRFLEIVRRVAAKRGGRPWTSEP